jgi:hypothetical protein
MRVLRHRAPHITSNFGHLGGSRSGGGSKYSDIKHGQNFGRTIVSERGGQYCVEQSVRVAVHPHSSLPFKTLSRSSSSTSMLPDTALLKNIAEVQRLKAAKHALRGDPIRGAEKEENLRNQTFPYSVRVS